MSNNLVKRLLSEFLSFLQYKIDNDLLTMEEMDSLSKTVETNLKLIGTVDDFAKFYDQPRTNISSVIHRKLLDKPKRRVFYSSTLSASVLSRMVVLPFHAPLAR